REDRDPGGGVGPVPLDYPLEEHADGREVGPDRARSWSTARLSAFPSSEPALVVLDVASTDVGCAADVRVGFSQEPGEPPEDAGRMFDTGRPKGHGDLVQVGVDRLGQAGVGGGKVGSHRRPPRLWASMASDARRYSPASQSSARCR